MPKPERLEDLGRIREKLELLIQDSIFENTSSKHGFEMWKKLNHDKEEFGEIEGLEGIFCAVRFLRERLDEIYYISCGDHDVDP